MRPLLRAQVNKRELRFLAARAQEWYYPPATAGPDDAGCHPPHRPFCTVLNVDVYEVPRFHDRV